MRFYLDEDISPVVAEIARRRGLDVLSSHECGRNGLDDRDQLESAASEGRCLVTRNRNDFVALTVSFFERETPHAGVLILSASLPGDRFSDAAAALESYHLSHREGMAPYTIDFLHPRVR